MAKVCLGLPIEFGWSVEQVQEVVGPLHLVEGDDEFAEYLQGAGAGGTPRAEEQPGLVHHQLPPTGIIFCFDFGTLTQLRILHEDALASKVAAALRGAYGPPCDPEGIRWDIERVRVMHWESDVGSMVSYDPLPSSF